MVHDTWVQQESVEVCSLPSLNEDFIILIPLQYIANQPIHSITIKLLSSTRQVLRVYRINGSALSNEYLYDADASTPNADVVSYPYVKMAGSTYW